MNDAIHALQRSVLEQVAARRPTSEILDRLCELIQQAVPHGLATVMRYDAVQNSLTFCNAPSAPAEVLEAFGVLTPGPFAGSCGSSVFERQMVAVFDTSTDPRWQNLREVAATYGIKACWSVPIFLDEQTIAGTFAISRTVAGSPSDEQRKLLELAAYLAGVAIRIERTEGRAAEQSNLLRAVIDCAEDPIFVKGIDGRYRLVNEAEARHRGLSCEQMVGRSDEDLYGLEQMRESIEYDRRVVATNESIVHELEVTSKVDGEQREYLIRKDPLRDDDGSVVGIVGIARDLTERRRVERAMQQAQKLESLGVLAGGVAHDFNNLLVGMMANAALIEESHEVPDELRKSATDIRIASQRAAELTSQLMQYAGKRQPARQALDLAELLGEIPTLLPGTVCQRSRLVIDLEPDLPVIAADPVQIRQVLMNLILNAADAYEGSDGVVRVRARLRRGWRPTSRLATLEASQQDWLEITVEDEGSGMDRDTQARIFEPFFTTKDSGRGLGLAAVLGIISGHGGCLDVRSRPGEGTTFWISLPATPAGAVLPPAPRQGCPSAADGRVLVVEDEEVIGSVMKRILARQGLGAEVAADGESGLRRIEAEPNGFDLLIFDFTMPGLDGAELARRVRALGVDAPIVLTSGLGEMEARAACAHGTVDAFLCKPFTPSDVAAAIAEARTRGVSSTG
ncbi:MAG: ATP-binding protein [Planctomycetota bacterium]